MKLKFVLLFVAALILQAAHSQSISIKGGFSLVDGKALIRGKNVSTSPFPGAQIGMTGEIRIIRDLYLNTGILFTQKGHKMNLSGVVSETTINYMEIPLNIVYKYDRGAVRYFAQAGPYAGAGLSSKMKSGGKVVIIGFGTGTDQIRKWDYGVNFGTGAEIKSFRLCLNYGLGLTNISNYPDEVLKNRLLTLSLAITTRYW